MKQKTRIIIYIAIAVTALALGIIAVLSIPKEAPAETADEFINAGNKYLIELSYDKAVIEFNKAIEIEPRNADAYIGLAEAYKGLGEEEKAIEALELGYEKTGDERIKELLDELLGEEEVTEVTTAEVTTVVVTTEETTVETTIATAPEETTEITTEATTETTETTTEITTKVKTPLISVPDFRGKNEDEALKIGENLGIKIEIKREPSDEIPEGEVISQDVTDGSEIEKGEKVVIVVSEGKKLEYTIELVEEFLYDTDNYNFETGEYDRIYTLKSDLNLNTSTNYPYIRRYGHGENEEVGFDTLYYDYSYEGEIYYSIETGTSSIKLPEKYYLVEQFSENMAYFRRDKVKKEETFSYTAGYIDTTGNEIFSYMVEEEYASSWGSGSGYGPLSFYDYKNNFNMVNGTAAFTTDGEHYGIIDKNGNVVVKPKYDYVCTFTDDMAAVGMLLGKYGFVNKNCKLVIDMKFDEILWGFEDGLAIVGIQDENYRNKYGVIDKSGNWIVPCKYDTCYISDNNSIVVGVEKERKTEYGTQRYTHYGLYDKTGDLILEPSYTFIYSGSPLEINGTQIRRSSDKFIYGDSDSVILAENDNGVLLYDLNGNLITSIDNYCIDYYNNEGYGIALMFDPTGIVKITERTDDYSIEGKVKFMDKSGNIYDEHPYGLGIYDYFKNTNLDGYYTFFYCNHDDWSVEGKTYKIS